MKHFAALLIYCFCCTTIAIASNSDQGMGATTSAPERVTATQTATKAQTVHRNNVMQAPKLPLWNGQGIAGWPFAAPAALPVANMDPGTGTATVAPAKLTATQTAVKTEGDSRANVMQGGKKLLWDGTRMVCVPVSAQPAATEAGQVSRSQRP